MSKFNLNQLLSGGTTRSGDQGYKIAHISVHNLEPSQGNFYSVEQIEELKASIAAFGIKQNLIVKAVADDKYRVIAGHRRRLAVLSLVAEGKLEFEKIPCIVETEEDELRERLLLITTNSTARQLSDWEKIKQAQELRTLLEQIKKRDKIPGRLRELIANTLDTSPAQVGRMEAITKNLTPEFKEELKKGRVNMSTAYEISGMPEEQQQEAYEEYRERGNVSIKDVKEKKKEAKVHDEPERVDSTEVEGNREKNSIKEEEPVEEEDESGTSAEDDRETPNDIEIVEPSIKWKLEEVWIARDVCGNIIQVSDLPPQS